MEPVQTIPALPIDIEEPKILDEFTFDLDSWRPTRKCRKIVAKSARSSDTYILETDSDSNSNNSRTPSQKTDAEPDCEFAEDTEECAGLFSVSEPELDGITESQCRGRTYAESLIDNLSLADADGSDQYQIAQDHGTKSTKRPQVPGSLPHRLKTSISKKFSSLFKRKSGDKNLNNQEQ